MSKMAAEHDAINLSQGFPNFPVDTVLTDIVIRLAKNNVQYLPMAGYPPLLSNIALLVKKSTEEFFARNRNTSNWGYTSHIYNYSSFGKS
jgi:aspartate/methionine/tyrosine aminotransferase